MKISYGEERAAFRYAIGSTVTQWAGIEYGLSITVTTCLEPSNAQAALAAFRSIENFRSKLAFTDAALKNSHLAPRLVGTWEPLRRHIDGLSTLRNKIVHDRELVFPDGPIGRRYVLVPRDIRVGDNAPPSEALGVRRIHQAALQFSTAASALFDIVDLAHGREPQFGADVRKDTPAPQLAQLVRQMREALSPPP